MKLRALAPGKVNLSLFLGGVRDDARHELVTLLESVSLADELSLTTLSGGPDQVVSPGVEGPNLVAAALEGLRARGWRDPAVLIEVRKRVPVAGGMGGGSADTASALRLMRHLGRINEDLIVELATELGADVPSQLAPGLVLGTGAGDVVEPVAALGPHAWLILPQPFGLSTADVYREADRLGLGREPDDLEEALALVRGVVARPGAVLPGELVVNDLQAAALSLRPEIGVALDAALYAGAEHAIVCGSGPTVAGLYAGEDGHARATAGAAALAGRYPGACAVVPVDERFGIPQIA
jgi:4-diphosphocytidyl-2-C-methyl-D-erythritol kinase